MCIIPHPVPKKKEYGSSKRRINDRVKHPGKKQCWHVIEVSGGSEGGSDTNLTLKQLQEKFPNGKYWNHVGSSKNNQDGYTDTPCPSHNSTATCNCYVVNGREMAWQCQGFVMKCGYDACGSDPYTWPIIASSSALDDLKPGDIIRYFTTNGKHSIFVTDISGDTITFGDCNSDFHCKIRWGTTTTKQKLESVFDKVYCAPFELKQ